MAIGYKIITKMLHFRRNLQRPDVIIRAFSSSKVEANSAGNDSVKAKIREQVRAALIMVEIIVVNLTTVFKGASNHQRAQKVLQGS